MAIKVTCQQCGKVLRVRDELVGRRGRCPGCGAVITVPDAVDGFWEVTVWTRFLGTEEERKENGMGL